MVKFAGQVWLAEEKSKWKYNNGLQISAMILNWMHKDEWVKLPDGKSCLIVNYIYICTAVMDFPSLEDFK